MNGDTHRSSASRAAPSAGVLQATDTGRTIARQEAPIMTDMLIEDILLESECNAHGPAERFEHLEAQAEELSAQAKSRRVFDWTVQSVCDPASLVH
jgi:hypothetical protein